MTQDEMDDLIDLLMARYEAVNLYTIKKIAGHIKKIGKLTAATVHQIVVLAEMNENIAEINAMIARAAQLTQAGLYALYNEVLNETYADPRFARALTLTPLSPEATARLEHLAQAVSLQTAGTMYNLSNTTILSNTYREAIDRAVLAVTTGASDYQAQTRDIVKQLGGAGLQVYYPSGGHKRLDSAVRQNILGGASQIAQEGATLMGKELGFDAYELSAHMMCAPDHEPIQGRVFKTEEFEKMQSEQPFKDIDGISYDAIRRPIGQWNCGHIASPFSSELSTRVYSDETLEQYADLNAKGCTWHGQHYTMYEVSQRMRRLETAIRTQKTIGIAAQYAGDDLLRAQVQSKINALSAQYSDLCKAAGLKPKYNRTVVDGYKPYKG